MWWARPSCSVRPPRQGRGWHGRRPSLVDIQGLDTATHAVAASYSIGYVLGPLTWVDNIAWSLLAIGADRSRVLGWLPALGVAFMLTHYSGVLMGSDIDSLAAAVGLAVAFVPLGLALWRSAPPVSRNAWRGGLVVAGGLVVLYVFGALTGFAPVG